MEAHHIPEHLKWLLAACLSVSCVLASQHHGWVKSDGVPVPGATVTVTQGDKTFVTSTDDSGAYSFPNLADGIWTLRISMLGFSPISREIGVAPDAPSPNWDLTVLTLDALQNQLKPPAPAATAQAAPAPSASTAKAGPAPSSPT
ncbi:MAG: carboxypeptidase-like regulatory domain-containing protein, partial [Bryobacteraceae bacterium]